MIEPTKYPRDDRTVKVFPWSVMITHDMKSFLEKSKFAPDSVCCVLPAPRTIFSAVIICVFFSIISNITIYYVYYHHRQWKRVLGDGGDGIRKYLLHVFYLIRSLCVIFGLWMASFSLMLTIWYYTSEICVI